MKRTNYLLCAACLLAAITACTDKESPVQGTAPQGMVEVRPTLPGMLTVSPLSGEESGAAKSVATRTSDWEKNNLLENKDKLPLDAGSTLWLLVEGKTEKGEDYKKLKAYVVKGTDEYQSLYPCTVNPDGSVNQEEAAPLYLPFGEYKFRALSPARAFLNENGELTTQPDEYPGNFRQKVSNGDFLIANDGRYIQTTLKDQPIKETDDKVQIIELNPLINQTARLKFTISLDPTNPYLHSCDISPAGVEISGLQTAYGTGGEAWNWTSAENDTLIAYPGKKEERLILLDNNEGVSKNGTSLVIEAAVLPTDCTSTSIIILFNLSVNGIPTQYQMMLNQKNLRAGFSYHYKGTLSIEDGITAITWQNVSWNTDIELEI